MADEDLMSRPSGKNASGRSWLKGRGCLGLLLLLFVAIASDLASQDATNWLGECGNARIRAFLRDPVRNAENHVAAVEVEVENIWLNYPNDYVEPGIQVGVLQYQIDRCSTILTTETRLRFQKLKPGKHTITVRLLSSANQRLLAPAARLCLRIP